VEAEEAEASTAAAVMAVTTRIPRAGITAATARPWRARPTQASSARPTNLPPPRPARSLCLVAHFHFPAGAIGTLREPHGVSPPPPRSALHPHGHHPPPISQPTAPRPRVCPPNVQMSTHLLFVPPNQNQNNARTGNTKQLPLTPFRTLFLQERGQQRVGEPHAPQYRGDRAGGARLAASGGRLILTWSVPETVSS